MNLTNKSVYFRHYKKKVSFSDGITPGYGSPDSDEGERRPRKRSAKKAKHSKRLKPTSKRSNLDPENMVSCYNLDFNF